MFQKLIAGCLFTLIAINLLAGDFVPPRHNIHLGLGAMKLTTLDRVNSSLPYTGYGLSFLLGYSLDKQRFQINADNTFSAGSMHSIQYPDNPQLLQQYLYDKFNVTAFFRLRQMPEKKMFFYAGPQLKFTLGYRIKGNDVGNSVLAYNIASTTNVALKIVKYFDYKRRRKPDNPARNICVEGFLSFPLLGQVWYQPYIGLPDETLKEDGGFIDFNKTYSADPSNYIDWELGLKSRFFLRNGNALALQYTYSFTKTKPEFNPYKGQIHSLMFVLNYNLK